MDAAKHTPGPWLALCASPVVYDQCEVQSGRGDPIAGIWRLSDGKAEANALLIAAAPDMLEALKGILTANVDGKNVERYLNAIDAGRAALAKAEGRSDG